MFEHFDAAHPDPAVAALMVVKVQADHAMSAAGRPNPDDATIDAFVRAMSNAAAHQTGRWRVSLGVDPSVAPAAEGSIPTTFTMNRTTVTVSTADLSPTVRQMLSTCFGRRD